MREERGTPLIIGGYVVISAGNSLRFEAKTQRTSSNHASFVDLCVRTFKTTGVDKFHAQRQGLKFLNSLPDEQQTVYCDFEPAGLHVSLWAM
jgi:hypothetical protein